MENILIFKNKVQLNERSGIIEKYHFVYLSNINNSNNPKVIKAIEEDIMKNTTGESLSVPELINKYHLMFASRIFKTLRRFYGYHKGLMTNYGEILLECSTDTFLYISNIMNATNFPTTTVEFFDGLGICNPIFTTSTYNTFRLLDMFEKYFNEEEGWVGIQNLNKVILNDSNDVSMVYCNNASILNKDLSEVRKHPYNNTNNIYTISY